MKSKRNFRRLSFLLAMLLPTFAGGAQTLTTLHTFSGALTPVINGPGTRPQANLILSGNLLFGTTTTGGTNGNGTVFSVNTNGTGYVVLHTFTGGSDGGNPTAGLILSGNTLYGTASTGGSNYHGTVFSLTTNGASFSVLHTFTAYGGYYGFTNIDGSTPIAGLLLAGNTLYGTASAGGPDGQGTVFKLNTNGSGFSTLYGFGLGDGITPSGGLAMSGNILYGTTKFGGTASSGTVFQVATNGTGYAVLYDFKDGTDGANPDGGLILSGSTLYGTVSEGGVSLGGTIFKLNTNGAGLSVIYSFTKGNDGAQPTAGLILSGDLLYGTESYNGQGGVFAVSTNGTGFTELYNFNDGSQELSSLVLSGTTLYGTSSGGGNFNCGTIFSVTTSGSVATNLYSFPGNSDGSSPRDGLLLSGSTLYGTASEGGYAGQGMVFAIGTNGGGFTNLYSFTGGNDGSVPYAGLVLSGPTLYGATSTGGSNGDGTIFAVNTNGTGFSVLHTFAGDADGSSPNALILSGSTLFGTTSTGGASGNGTVFKLATGGTGFTNLHVFSALAGYPAINNDGAAPLAGLILSGNTLFGTSSGGGSNGSGTVFKLNTDGSGFTNVYTFSALDPSAVTNADGSNPSAGLILAGNILYSTTEAGGNYNSGTVFAVKTNGTSFTTLYAFTGGSDGGNPLAGLILSGNALYGTTFSDGNYGYGNVFLIDTNGANFTDIYDFTGGNDGGPVDAGLLLAGNTVYGVTEAGGSVGDGTVFGLALPDVNTTQLAILNLSLSGTNLVINGANGVSGGSYALFTTTNLALPLAQWSPVVTNVLGASGNFTITATNAVKRKVPKQFYFLEKQ